jgi:hypothetical protein
MTLPEGPGWEWNPGATFVTAFNNAQENKRANEKMAMEQQLSEILFPAKKAQAEFTIKQLAYESERMENSYKLLNEETDERRRLLRDGGRVGNPNTSNVAPAGGYQSRYGFGSKLSPVSTTPQTAQPTTRKVGSGLMPKTPKTP